MSLNIIDPNTLNGNFCFNGSIFVKYNIKTGKNKYTEIFSHKIPTKNYKDLQIFCVYRSTHVRFQTLNSSIHITPINLKTFQGNIKENIKIFDFLMNEDPRVMCLNDKLFLTYRKIINPIVRKYLKQIIRIEGIFLDTNFKKIGDDIILKKLNEKNIKQKNWTFFEKNGLIYIVYNIMPLEILIWNPVSDLLESFDTVPLILRHWKHPKYPNMVLRGGCPPIEVDGLLYLFVHSTDYMMFCFTLDPINFDILHITLKELIPNRGNKQDIHFPCGVIYDENETMFYISLGIDDSNLGIFSISKKELDLQMIKVHNFNSVIIKDDVWVLDMLESNMNLWINSWGGCGNDLLSIYCQQKGIICRSLPWDKLGCHYVKYVELPFKKIYIMSDPLISLATMKETKCLETNFYKLSNQISNGHQYTFTGLLYFMWIQLLNWNNINNTNVFIVKESNIRSKFLKLADYMGCKEAFFDNYPEKDNNIIKSLEKIEEITKLLEKENSFICNYIYKDIIDIYNKIN